MRHVQIGPPDPLIQPRETTSAVIREALGKLLDAA